MLVEVVTGIAEGTALLVMFLLARKKRYGWLISLANQITWILVGYLTGVFMFVVAAIVFGIVASHGYIHWKEDGKDGNPTLDRNKVR